MENAIIKHRILACCPINMFTPSRAAVHHALLVSSLQNWDSLHMVARLTLLPFPLHLSQTFMLQAFDSHVLNVVAFPDMLNVTSIGYASLGLVVSIYQLSLLEWQFARSRVSARKHVQSGSRGATVMIKIGFRFCTSCIVSARAYNVVAKPVS
jgi:hypothetical protein